MRAVKSLTRFVGSVRRRSRPVAPCGGLGEFVRASAGWKAVRRAPVGAVDGGMGDTLAGRADAGRLFSYIMYPPEGVSSSESLGSMTSMAGTAPWLGRLGSEGRPRLAERGGRGGAMSENVAEVVPGAGGADSLSGVGWDLGLTPVMSGEIGAPSLRAASTM